jgi:hypothetical protein
MKRLLALVATALLAFALYATTAQSGQQAVTPKQFAALSKKVTNLKKDVDAIGTILVSCVMGTAIPISRYTGYVAVDSAGATVATTALDVTDQGGTPNGYALLVNADPECVNLINTTSLRKLSAFKPMLRANVRPSFAHPKRHQ